MLEHLHISAVIRTKVRRDDDGCWMLLRRLGLLLGVRFYCRDGRGDAGELAVKP